VTLALPAGTVTILFSDIVSSTDLTTRREDDAAQDIPRAQGGTGALDVPHYPPVMLSIGASPAGRKVR
jgi:hypothetical protein